MANEAGSQGIGLVLTGGGGKGAYQVGVLKALKENGLLDDITAISGVSIGTVNSMLFAMEDINTMYEAWDDINLLTVFDIDLEMLLDRKLYFSRDEMLALVGKYISFDKIINSKYTIYSTICRIPEDNSKLVPEYRRLSDYSEEDIKKILLASTAMPVIYEPVEIDGVRYRDGGICDNEPVGPLYDMGIRQFIVIGLKYGKSFDSKKYPDADFKAIYPSHDIGELLDGTLDFTGKSIKFREELGYKDGLRAVKTLFNKDETYIKMEKLLAENDYNDIVRQLRTDFKIKSIENNFNSELEKFNNLTKKYENF